MVPRFKRNNVFRNVIDMLALARYTIKTCSHVKSNLGGGSRNEFVSA
jgi:hypothetical protein